MHSSLGSLTLSSLLCSSRQREEEEEEREGREESEEQEHEQEHEQEWVEVEEDCIFYSEN